MSVCGSCRVNAFVPATHGRKLHARIRALEVRVNERDVQMSRLLLRLSEAEAGLAAFVDYFDTWEAANTVCFLNGGPHVVRSGFLKIEAIPGGSLIILKKRMCLNCGLWDTFIQEEPEPYPPRMPP